MGDPARDEAYARANALHEQFRDDIDRQEAVLGVPPPDNYTTLIVADKPKPLREALCVAQTAVGQLTAYDNYDLDRAIRTREVLGRLIDECDRLRPLGRDGKHDFRHTPWCGCEVDDLDEPLIDESRIQANPDDGPNMARRYEAEAQNPRYPSGHLVPRRKGDPILPWRMPWRRLRRKRKG